ncbi:MAG: hypothetical protein AB7S78_05215 [Candidatus Omnitrophota bacterium]
MLRLTKYKKRLAQSAIEYTIILATIIAIMAAMGPMVRRSSQGWTKLVADQIGVQNLADQRFNDMSQSHLDSSFSISRADVNKRTNDVAGVMNYVYDDVVFIYTNAVINLGVQPNPN